MAVIDQDVTVPLSSGREGSNREVMSETEVMSEIVSDEENAKMGSASSLGRKGAIIVMFSLLGVSMIVMVYGSMRRGLSTGHAMDNQELYENPGCTEPQDQGLSPAAPAFADGSPCNEGLFADNPDGTIHSYNLVISDESMAFLNADPKAEEYVPCDLVINHGASNSQTVGGARCRYKGSAGSWSGCVGDDGKKLPNAGNEQCRKLSWKINLKNAVNYEAALGVKKMQFLGIQGDDSLIHNRLAYAILNDAGFIAPCAAPAHVYINGVYNGIYDNVETIDKYFTRNRFANDENEGKSQLWKETWPVSTDESFYGDDDHMQEISGLSSPGCREQCDEDDPNYAYLFANLRRDALDCLQSGNACDKLQASQILDTYVDAQSFIDGLVGMTMTGNWDQITSAKHNFYFYVKNDKLFYLPWDFNWAFGAGVTGEVPKSLLGLKGEGSEPLPFPWHYEISDEQRKHACPYSWEIYAFTCDPVMHLMAKAWTERFYETFAAVSQKDLVSKAYAHVNRWTAQSRAGIACDAANNNIPTVSSNEDQVDKVVPLFEEILYFWNGLPSGKTTWPASRALEKESCFPGHATVEVSGRGRMPIADLKVGDHVRALGPAGDLVYEPVISFLHVMPADSARQHSFIAVRHLCGEFQASSNHIVFVSEDGAIKDKLVRDLEFGDVLLRKTGGSSELQKSLEACPVLHTHLTRGNQGMYAPLTGVGTILVDDVVASTYASAHGFKFPHGLMHAIFFPVRVYHWLRLSSFLTSLWTVACSRNPAPWLCQGDGQWSKHGLDEMHPLPFFFSKIMKVV